MRSCNLSVPVAIHLKTPTIDQKNYIAVLTMQMSSDTSGGRNSTMTDLSLSTRLLHVDSQFDAVTPDVAPPLHVSTTFRYSSDPNQLIPYAELAVG